MQGQITMLKSQVGLFCEEDQEELEKTGPTPSPSEAVETPLLTAAAVTKRHTSFHSCPAHLFHLHFTRSRQCFSLWDSLQVLTHHPDYIQS